ncbi:MAG: DUF1795 domain-containing protein [Clostridiales bacterium]|nr:DUF1795 domain-containing protein [Clostridiales bacterium]
MKKIITALLICIIAFTAFSCGDKGTAPLGFKEISDEALTYHLYVPDEWTADISTGVTSAYFSGRDPSNISLVAFELDTNITSIDDYWTLNEAELKQIFPNMEYVDTSDCTLDGTPAKQYIYTASMGEQDYKFMQLVAIKNNQVYIFTYTAFADMYDTHIEDVIAILDYFSFK